MEILCFDDSVKNRAFKDIPTVISIGVFDGVHRGHQKVLNTLEKLKREKGVKSLVITFNVNPKGESNGVLMSLKDRLKYIERIGIDYTLLIDFTPSFSLISERDFIRMLAASFDISGFVLGRDFKIGSPSTRSASLTFEELLLREGVKADVIEVGEILTEGGEKISSTLLRRVIEEGRLDEYETLSSHHYSLDAENIAFSVFEGSVIMRKTDFISLLPKEGIYDASLEGGEVELKGKVSITSDLVVFTPLDGSLPDEIVNQRIKIESITL